MDGWMDGGIVVKAIDNGSSENDGMAPQEDCAVGQSLKNFECSGWDVEVRGCPAVSHHMLTSRLVDLNPTDLQRPFHLEYALIDTTTSYP